MTAKERLEFLFIAILWSIGPLLPALSSGNIAGSPYTDLYPSVWSLWATEDWWGVWRTLWLNHPNGQTWQPSCILWGTLLIPLKPFFNIGTLYNFSIIVSRLLGCAAFYAAGRAKNEQHLSGLLWMLLIAMSPMVHGFAVEGIIEGTQIWPLGLWLWSTQKGHHRLSFTFAVLIILSNWYWACIWGLLQTIRLIRSPKEVLLLLLPIIATAPWWLLFLQQTTITSIHSDVLRAMGFQFGIPTPNLLTAPNPFAQSTYLGWILLGWSAWLITRSKDNHTLIIVMLGFTLSLGLPWMQSVPVLSAIRFPYRLHLLTLIGIAYWLSHNIQWRPIHRYILGLIYLEALLCSPIDIFLPSAPSAYPDYTTSIDGAVLELPGPLQRPPGTFDPSRPRMKYLMYYQTGHQQPNGWQLGFNGLHTSTTCFQETRIVDPHATIDEKQRTGKDACWDHIDWVIIHNRNNALRSRLTDLGFQEVSTGLPVIWHRKDATDD